MATSQHPTTSLPEIPDIRGSAASCPKHPVHPSDGHMNLLTHVVAPTLFGIFVVIGVVGNSMVIAVILRTTIMRNTTNILIMSLATADLIFIVCCVPFTAVTYASDGWPLGSGACKMYMYMIYVTAYCSVYTLVLMSVDRYIAVVHPLASSTLRTNRNALICVVCQWVVIMTANLPLALNSDIVSGHQNEHGDCIYYCTYLPLLSFNKSGLAIDEQRLAESSDVEMVVGRTYERDADFARLYFGAFFIFGYVLPLVTITGFYTRLVFELFCGRAARVSRSRQSMVSKRRVTRLVVVIIIVFALSWLPIQIIFLIQHFGSNPHNLFFRTVHVISNCLAYANSSINPILYAFLSDNFRSAFRQLLFHEKRPTQLRPAASNAARLTQFSRTVRQTSIKREFPKEDGEVQAIMAVTDL